MPTWQPGEHVTVIGDTGTGKTYLMARLVELRRWVVVLKTKSDRTKFPGDFRHARRATALDNPRIEKVVIEPVYERQAREGWLVFEKVWKQQGWTLVIDELWYVERLGLSEQVERMLTQARSKDITAMVGMQRPVTQSRFAISQCTHLFTFGLEGRDAKTVAEATTPRILPIIESLTGHDFAYFNRRTKEVRVGNANRLDEIFPQKTIDSDAGLAHARASVR
jgi:hypothetical protein